MYTWKRRKIRHKMKKIQNKFHQIATYKINKFSLSCFDEKSYILMLMLL